MDILPLARNVLNVVVATGAGAVVGNLIKRSTPQNLPVIKKAALSIGGFVISHAVGSWAVEYTNDQIDTTIRQAKEAKAVAKQIKAKFNEAVVEGQNIIIVGDWDQDPDATYPDPSDTSSEN